MGKLKKWVSAVVLSAGTLLHADLIRNGDFNGNISEEAKLTGNTHIATLSDYTEDLTGNKCMKLVLNEYHVNDDGVKSYGAGLIIGGEKGLSGFPVEPNSTYKFSLELKGTLYRAFVNAAGWSGGGNDQTGLGSTLGIVKVQKDWVKYRGTFKTKADTTRAALNISIWGDENYKDMPDKEGSYLLIDNVNIEKAADSFSGSLNNPAVAVKPVDPKKAVIATDAGKVPVFDGKLDDEVWRNASKINNFYFYKNTTPATTPTEARIIAGKDALWLGITCTEPEMGTLQAAYSGDGGAAIWKNDEVEIFFDAVKPGRTLNQFVVSAGGGRWMGWGGQPSQPTEKDYQLWEVKTAKGANGWTAEVKIAYAALELPKRPEQGFTLPFNIARQRKAGGGELSSWNAVKGNFHNKEYYGVLAFDTLLSDLKKRVDDMNKSFASIKDVSSADREKLDAVKSVIAKWEKSLSAEPTAEAWAEAYVALEQVKTDIKFLCLSKLTFAVTAVSPYKTDFTVPVLPEDISADDAKISCRAAVNEFKGVPILITNLRDATQEYRVFIYSSLNDGIEVPGLKDFPIEKILLRQGVRVKDSDGAEHGQMFDPLVGMNEAMTTVIPPKDSGLVWLTFDCVDVKPGTYDGFIRVIPLNEPAKFDLIPAKGWTYEGSARDIPFALDVLPIELSREPVAPLWLMRAAANEKFFKDMIEHDNRVFQLSPWYFMFDFRPDGSIAKERGDGVSKFNEVVRQHLEWSKKYKIHPQFLLGFSAYSVFEDNHLAKAKINYGTAEWKNAWKNWVTEVDKTFKELGVDYKDYCVEVWDEPLSNESEKVLETCRLAKEVAPGMRLQITFGATKHTDTDMIKMIPYVDIWCFWGSYYDDPGFQVILNKLKAADKAIWMYFCNTNLDSSLYKYYRMHAWKGRLYENQVIGLFTYLCGPGGFYGRQSWKCEPGGALVYNSLNTPVISIRYECLREGVTDIKYLKKLEEVAAKAKAAGVAGALVKEAEALLASAPYEVAEKYNYDAGTADKFRDKAIDLILKIQKEIK